MYCPTCGADVPEMKYCQNCGSSLFVGAAPTASDVGEQSAKAIPYESQAAGDRQESGNVRTPYNDQSSFASQMSYTSQPSSGGQATSPAQGQYASQTPYAGIAPSTAFVLAIVGLVMGLLGFSLITIVPAVVCCIIALVLNSKYNKAGQYNPHKTSTTVMSVIGLVASALSLAFFVAVGIGSIWFFNEYGDELDSADIEEVIESFDGERERTSSSAAASVLASSAASALGVDERAFDSRGNATLYALSELSGKEISDALKARGYVWEESAQAWMASNGAVFEVQDDGGLMSQDAIERLDAGAQGDSVAYAALVVGYDTPAAALDALSSGVELNDTCADSEGAIVFAIIEGSDGNDRLVAVSETGKKQHMVFLFTEKAVESGLFSEITGVSRGKSIEGVWKVLNAK